MIKQTYSKSSKKIVFFLLYVAVLFSACKNFGGKRISEGEIVYTITYPNSKNNMMTSLLPTEMVYKFKGDKSISDFNASMGLFGMSIISDYKNKTLTQLVKVLNDKKGISFNQKQVKDLINEEDKMKIEFTKETKIISGYKCKKAVITFENPSRQGFDIFYTNDLAINNPNWYTIFKDIDGVILEYQISRYNIDMKLTAKTVTQLELDDEVFTTPTDYRMVSRREIDDVFESFN